MRNSEKLLRSLIREIHLREDKIATLTLQDTDKFTADSDSVTRILSPSNAKFMRDFMDKKDRQGRIPPLPSWAATRMERISERLSPAAALAASFIFTKNDCADPTSPLGQLISGHGSEKGQIPANLDLMVPPALEDLAMEKREGKVKENTGRGEGLVIFLFGRDKGSNEPDIVINKIGYSVKYFETDAKTVKSAKFSPQPNIVSMANDTKYLLFLARNAKQWRPYGGRAASNQINRIGVQELFNFIRDPSNFNAAKNEILGEPAALVQSKLSNAIGLWNLSFSDHDVLALHRPGDGSLKLTLVPRDKVTLGALRWDQGHGPYELASPARGAIPVT